MNAGMCKEILEDKLLQDNEPENKNKDSPGTASETTMLMPWSAVNGQSKSSSLANHSQHSHSYQQHCSLGYWFVSFNTKAVAQTLKKSSCRL